MRALGKFQGSGNLRFIRNFRVSRPPLRLCTKPPALLPDPVTSDLDSLSEPGKRPPAPTLGAERKLRTRGLVRVRNARSTRRSRTGVVVPWLDSAFCLMEPPARFRPPSSPPPAEWCAPYLVFRSNRLPPLPPVVEEATLELALMHKTGIPRAELDELDPLLRERNDLRTNRRFEWEGDALFTWLVTEELVQRFPLANPGDLSVSYAGWCAGALILRWAIY